MKGLLWRPRGPGPFSLPLDSGIPMELQALASPSTISVPASISPLDLGLVKEDDHSVQSKHLRQSWVCWLGNWKVSGDRETATLSPGSDRQAVAGLGVGLSRAEDQPS